MSNKLGLKILIWNSCCEGGQWSRQQPSWRYLMCDKNVKFKRSERRELIRKLRHLKWNCGIDIYDKANLLSSVLTEGDFYEEARKWGCQLNPTSITKTSLEKPFIVRKIIHFKLKRALNTPKTCGTISFRGFDKISSIRSTQLNWSEQTTSTQNPI